jgi:DNA primase
LELVAPDAREVLERAAVADLTLDAQVEAKTLIAAAVRRELRARVGLTEREAIDDDRQARLDVELLSNPDKQRGLAAAESLLGWLNRRSEERLGGAS